MSYELVYDLAQVQSIWDESLFRLLVCITLAGIVYRFPTWFSGYFPSRVAKRRAIVVGVLVALYSGFALTIHPDSEVQTFYLQGQTKVATGQLITHAMRSANNANLAHFRVGTVTFNYPRRLDESSLTKSAMNEPIRIAKQALRVHYVQLPDKTNHVVRIEIQRSS